MFSLMYYLIEIKNSLLTISGGIQLSKILNASHIIKFLLFNLVCSSAPVTNSVNEESYGDYISIFQSPFGVKYDRNTFYESNQQLILNDFHTLYDMQYLIEGRHIGDLHFQNGNISEPDNPFFCAVFAKSRERSTYKRIIFF